MDGFFDDAEKSNRIHRKALWGYAEFFSCRVFHFVYLKRRQYNLRRGTCMFGAFCKSLHPRHAGGSLNNVPVILMDIRYDQ